jgi:hypothetical protein
MGDVVIIVNDGGGVLAATEGDIVVIVDDGGGVPAVTGGDDGRMPIRRLLTSYDDDDERRRAWGIDGAIHPGLHAEGARWEEGMG